MTDKVQKIIAEIKDRISNYQEYIDSGYDDEEVIKQEELKDLLTFIDSLQEEPKECMYSKDNYIDEDRKALCDGCETECRFNKKEELVSEDLEEFINTIKLLTSNTALLTFEYGCREGAKWQKQQDQSVIELAEDHAMLAGMEKMKEQMLAKAVDTEVKVDAGGYPYVDATIELYDYDKDIPLAKEGDKYKVILIKEG